MSSTPSGAQGLRITDLAKRHGSVVAADGIDIAVP